MILKMERLSVFGLMRDKDAVVSELMRARCIQIQSPQSMEEYEQLEPLTQSCSADAYEMETQLGRYAAALSSMSLYSAKSGMFDKRPRVGFDRLEDAALLDKAEELCQEIESVTGKISDSRGAKSKDIFTKASLEPWRGSDLPLELSSTAQTVIQYCLFPPKTDLAELEARQALEAPSSRIDIVGEDRDQKYLLVICLKSQEAALWEILKEFGATRTAFAGLTGTPEENIRRLEDQIAGLDASVAAQEARLRELGQELYPLKYAHDALSVRVQRKKAEGSFLATQKTFLFTAWVPETAKAEAVAILEAHGCHYELRDPADDEEPPVLLKNPKWVQPYETVTAMYSLPAYRGFDPNCFVAVTYFIFFGMMLGDAGFGLILFIGGLILGKKVELGPGAKGIWNVITWGGLSATIWGLVFGSIFGDTITVVSGVFFGRPIVITPLLDPIGQAITVMGLCLVLGLLHIFMGLGIKAYILIKHGDPWAALFDVGFWITFIVGLLCMLGGAFLGDSLMTVGKWMAIISAVGLILMGARDKKNPFMRILSGIAGLYDISGYLSDVLSYSRILALGLATGVIAQVFNIIGTLFGGGIVGALFYIVIFSIGSALNIAINTLGSYVHTARLHYVEFFGKFYETGGKAFMPFMPQTRYIVVTNKEEM